MTLQSASGTLLATCEQTQEQFSLMTLTIPAHDAVPFKADSRNRCYYVLEGSLHFESTADPQNVEPGTCLIVGRQTPHALRAGEAGVSVLAFAAACDPGA